MKESNVLTNWEIVNLQKKSVFYRVEFFSSCWESVYFKAPIFRPSVMGEWVWNVDITIIYRKEILCQCNLVATDLKWTALRRNLG
jgi:repressor of nif and glnA expression